MEKSNHLGIVCTCFKVGSCTLFNNLCNTSLSDGIWLPNFDKSKINNKYYFIKSHSAERIKTLNPDVVFTIVRDPLQVYQSAYFHDIIQKEYDYYYGDENKVLNDDIQKIVNHFTSFNWTSYDYLDQVGMLEKLEKNYSVDIFNQSRLMNEKQYMILNGTRNNKPVKICIMSIKILKNIDKLKIMLKELGYSKEFINELSFVNSNVGTSKWYGEKYNEFKKSLNTDFFDKYKNVSKKLEPFFQ